MATPVLTEKDSYPTDNVLESATGKVFPVLQNFFSSITSEKYLLEPEWKYYNDGKSWLCKISFKKKTVLWLSVWDGYFKTGFYFTDKTKAGIFELGIDEEIKENFRNAKPVGKLIPLTIEVRKMKQLKDVLTVIEYKKKVK